MNKCLLVDMGNSRIKWAWLTEQTLCPEHAAYDGDDVTALLERCWAGLERPQAVWLSCVGGRELKMTDWVAEHWQLDVQIAVSCPAFGDLRNGYLEPERLGIDRWLAMIGARAAFPGRALCVLDLGTAVTLDIVEASGQHLGGYIMPGLTLMRDSLKLRTGLLSGPYLDHDPGRDTASAIGLGTLNAVVGLLQQAIARYQTRYPDIPQIMLTGGDADVLAAALHVPHEQRPALVLEGLAELAKQGTQKPCVG